MLPIEYVFAWSSIQHYRSIKQMIKQYNLPCMGTVIDKLPQLGNNFNSNSQIRHEKVLPCTVTKDFWFYIFFNVIENLKFRSHDQALNVE